MNKRCSLGDGWLKRLATAAVVTAVLVLWWWEHQTAVGLRVENATLRRQCGEADALRAENRRLRSLELDVEELRRLRSENRTLPKLRGELAGLRRQLDELRQQGKGAAAAPASTQDDRPNPGPLRTWAVGTFLSSEEWSEAGVDTPENAVQTLFHARYVGDTNRLARITLEGSIASDFTLQDLANAVQNGAITLAPTWTSADPPDYRTLEGGKVVFKRDSSPREIQINVEEQWPGGRTIQSVLTFRLDGNEWKFAPGCLTEPIRLYED